MVEEEKVKEAKSVLEEATKNWYCDCTNEDFQDTMPIEWKIKAAIGMARVDMETLGEEMSAEEYEKHGERIIQAKKWIEAAEDILEYLIWKKAQV